MEYQESAERKRKMKIVGVATIAAIVVLAIGIWVVISAVRSINNSKTVAGNQTSVAKVDDGNKQGATKDTAKDAANKSEPTTSSTTTSPADQYSADTSNSAPSATATTGSNTATAEDIPTTGPAEDAALAALLAGVATYLVALNLRLKKSPRTLSRA